MHLKKILFIIFFLPVILKAQDTPDRKNFLGIKNGLVRSNLKKSPYETSGYTGITLGVAYCRSLGKKISLQTELSYTSKGYKQYSAIFYPSIYSFMITGGGVNSSNKFIYIDLPVLLNYHLVNKKIVIGLQAGTGMNFFMTGTSDIHFISSGNKGVYPITTEFMNVTLLAGSYLGVKFDRVKILVNPRLGINILRSPFGSFKYAEVSYMVVYEF